MSVGVCVLSGATHTLQQTTNQKNAKQKNAKQNKSAECKQESRSICWFEFRRGGGLTSVVKRFFF